jgi:hypothetical protein
LRQIVQRGKQMLDGIIAGKGLRLLKAAGVDAVSLYLPVSWAASTNCA